MGILAFESWMNECAYHHLHETVESERRGGHSDNIVGRETFYFIFILFLFYLLSACYDQHLTNVVSRES